MPSFATYTNQTTEDSRKWASNLPPVNTSISQPTSRQPSPSSSPRSSSPDGDHRYRIVDDILITENLYHILGVSKTSTSDEIRRAYISKSRVCHPDKFPEYPKATEAFQKLSFAYETLAKPSSRHAYDLTGSADGRSNGQETLQGVLYQIFLEFMDGDFEMIRIMINTLNQSNPNLNLGEDVIENMEFMFRKLRELFLAGQKYLTSVQFQLLHLHELQHSLRQLSYFDVFGRLRLTIQLSRVCLSIPMRIQQQAKEEGGAFLNDKVELLLKGIVALLEKGERIV